MQREIFAPHGLLMLAPQAFGQFFDVLSPPKTRVDDAVVCVVPIRGPLQHHFSWCNDSYDAVKERLACVFASNSQAIVLDFDSPGGVVNGVFELAQWIREMSLSTKKPVHAYVSGQCCSAAYALACACASINAPEMSIVGSIGVLDCIVDATAADRMNGLRFALISSGERKVDGNPHNSLSEATVAAAQARVDEIANYFFNFVAASRPLSADAVRALEAETFTGLRSRTLQLVDGVLTLDSLIASLTINPQGEQQMAKYDDSMAALMAEADGDDPKKATRAKKALAAMFAEDKNEEEGGESAESSEDGEEGGGESDDEKKKKADEEAKAKAVAASSGASAQASGGTPSASTELDLALRVNELEANAKRDKLEREKQEKERTANTKRDSLLASRPDLSKELVAALQKLPPERVEEVLKGVPKIGALRTEVPTRAAGEGSGDSAPMTAERKAWNDEMDRAMGKNPKGTEPYWEGSTYVVPQPGSKKGDSK